MSEVTSPDAGINADAVDVENQEVLDTQDT